MRRARLLGAVAAVGGLAVTVVALRSRKNIWAAGHGRDGFSVHLTEVPLWAEMAEDMLDVLPCIHPRWDWLFKVGSRRFGTYDDGDPLYTLGSAMMRVCDMRHSITFHAERDVARIPLTREQMLKVDAEWVARCDRIFDEDDEEFVHLPSVPLDTLIEVHEITLDSSWD